MATRNELLRGKTAGGWFGFLVYFTTCYLVFIAFYSNIDTGSILQQMPGMVECTVR